MTSQIEQPVKRPVKQRTTRSTKLKRYNKQTAHVEARRDGKPLIFGWGKHLSHAEKVKIQRRATWAIAGIFGFLIVVAMAGSIFGLKVWYGTPQGRFVLDTIVLKLPVLGILMRKIAVARFTRTLGTLISSGVPILEGLDITARTAGNAVVERALMKVRKSLEEGKSLTEPLKEAEVFPGMVTQMIAVGEQTGAMDAMLQKIADFYEEEVDAAVKDLLTALEPIMIVFLGLVVGGVVISMYLPLFSLIGKLSNSH